MPGRVGSGRVESVPFGSIWFHSVPFGFVRFRSVLFDTTRFNSAPFGSNWYRFVSLGISGYGSVGVAPGRVDPEVLDRGAQQRSNNDRWAVGDVCDDTANDGQRLCFFLCVLCVSVSLCLSCVWKYVG